MTIALPAIPFGLAPPAQDWFELGTIAGTARSPGKCEIRGAALIRTFQKAKGWGYSGATLRYTGEDLCDFEIAVTLWEPEHWPLWNVFSAQALQPAPVGPIASAMDIRHPILNGPPLNIHAVVVREVGQFEQDELGAWTAVIKLSQFRAPLPALGALTQSIPDVASSTPTAKNAAQVEQTKLAAEVDAQLAILAGKP